MIKSLKLIGCVAASGVLLLAACKKKTDAVEDAKKNIVASWRLSDVVIDSNENNVMDAHEYENLDSVETDVVTFKADGTGDLEGIPVTWRMIDANRFNFSFVNGRGELDTLNATIKSASRFDVYLPQQAPDHNGWFVFKKK